MRSMFKSYSINIYILNVEFLTIVDTLYYNNARDFFRHLEMLYVR
ncbi:hypothetical protein VCSRO127_3286 [Vibrio cholerae]|nr:hypothetical protein VCSRO127_3286 [Vibrio cholerae]